jgi:hypothetical protein
LGDWATAGDYWAKGERAISGRPRAKLLLSNFCLPGPLLCSRPPGAWANAPGVKWAIGRTKTGRTRGPGDPGRTFATSSRRHGPRGRDEKGREKWARATQLSWPVHRLSFRARKGPLIVPQEGDTPAGDGSCYCTLGELGCEPGDFARLHVSLSNAACFNHLHLRRH